MHIIPRLPDWIPVFGYLDALKTKGLKLSVDKTILDRFDDAFDCDGALPTSRKCL